MYINSNKKERNPFRCILCGKYFYYNEDFYIWTPFGSYGDIEPPDKERAHKHCYENYYEFGKELIYKTSWIKPSLLEWSKECL